MSNKHIKPQGRKNKERLLAVIKKGLQEALLQKGVSRVWTIVPRIGMDKDVMLASAETAEMESMVKRWKTDDIHSIYVDSKIILAVLLVYGVDPNDIHDTHRD